MIYKYTRIHIYIYVYTHIRIYIYIQVHTHVYMHIYIGTKKVMEDLTAGMKDPAVLDLKLGFRQRAAHHGPSKRASALAAERGLLGDHGFIIVYGYIYMQ